MEESISFTKEDINVLRKIIELLMENKVFVRKFAPKFEITVKNSDNFIKNFKEIAEELIPMLVRLRILNLENYDFTKPLKKKLKNDLIHPISEFKDVDRIYSYSEFIDLIQNKIIVVSSNSFKKKLKSKGLNPQFIKSIGGPLDIDDYKRINRSIPENVLEGIKKKNINLTSEIIRLVKKGKQVIFLFDPENLTDNMNLERFGELQRKFKIKIEIIDIKSLNFL